MPGALIVEPRASITANTVEKAQSLLRKYPSQNRTGLLVTAELEQALNTCKAKVERLSAECRASNRKFRYESDFLLKPFSFVLSYRDIEFDLQNDSTRCQFGLDTQSKVVGDVKRVTEIFDRPEFFKDSHPSSSDIIQGALGDCWFLSALGTMSSAPGLIEKLCVAVSISNLMNMINTWLLTSIYSETKMWASMVLSSLRMIIG